MEGGRTDRDEAAFEAAFDRVFGDDEAARAEPVSEEGAGRDDGPGADGEVVAGDGTGETPAFAPEVGEEPAGASGAGEPAAGSDAMERLRQHARTTEGRLAALQAEKTALEEELVSFRAGRAGDGPVSPASSEQEGAVTLPEDLARDAEEFDTLYPELASLLRQPGSAGDRLRRVLRDSGPDMASLAAEAMQTRRGAAERIESLETRIESRTRQEHLSRIAGQHPEVRGLLTGEPDELEAARTYVAGVTAWIEGLPYREAGKRLRVMQEGTADEVSGLLAEYKTAQAPPAGSGLDGDTRRRAGEAAGVDNRRGKVPAAVSTPKERADAAWDRIFGG